MLEPTKTSNVDIKEAPLALRGWLPWQSWRGWIGDMKTTVPQSLKSRASEKPNSQTMSNYVIACQTAKKRNAWAFMTSVSWVFHSWFSSQIFTFLRSQTVTHSISLSSTTHDVEKGWKRPACTLEVHWCSAQLPVQYHVRQACWWRQYQ